MKIINKKLIEVTSADLVNGVFVNNEIEEIADNCFYNMPELKKVVCKNVKIIGNYCFRDNPALTSIALNALTTCGKSCFRYNQALTSIALNALTTCGNYCFHNNQALTSIAMNALTTCGDDCFRYNPALTSIALKNKNLTTKSVDGYCFVIETTKTSKAIKIYQGYNFNSIKENKIICDYCFVIEKENFTAHGTTLKKAISDLQFKIVAEKLKNEPINPDTLFTVKHYRLLTGACDFGVRNWMRSNNIPFKIIDDETVEVNPIKASDLFPILERTDAYGFEKIKQLVTF